MVFSRQFMGACCLLLLAFPVNAESLSRVVMKTNLGEMEIELYAGKAPVTVENFLNYVKSGFYKGTVFHRVVYGWIIQGGGYDKDLNLREPGAPIVNEADNGLKNVRGTIAMARTSDPDSADSQFFINLQYNPSFDFKAKTRRGWGYCVFGHVVKGMKVADAISEVEKHEVEGFGSTVPVEPVIIQDITLIQKASSDK